GPAVSAPRAPADAPQTPVIPCWGIVLYGWQHGGGYARVHAGQGQIPHAPAPDRGPGPRPAEDGRRRQVLHRHPDPGVGGDQRPPVGGPRPARGSPRALRGPGDGRGRRRRGREGPRGVRGDRPPRQVLSVITTSTTDLIIGGMTCASCAARVERKLNRLDGVTATVNFATEAARVSFPETLTVGDLIATVERTGYTAALPAPPDAGQ